MNVDHPLTYTIDGIERTTCELSRRAREILWDAGYDPSNVLLILLADDSGRTEYHNRNLVILLRHGQRFETRYEGSPDRCGNS